MDSKERLVPKMVKKYVIIKSFTPKRVELSDGTVLEAGKGSEFDYDTLKKIIEDEPELIINK